MFKKPSEKNPEERIHQLQERAAELADGEIVSWSSGDVPPEVLAQFWENVVAYEEATPVRPLDVLVEGGLELPPSSELDDETLSEKLRELVQAMALRGLYLVHTNHLSDRQLYVDLLEDVLLEETVMPMGEDGPATNCIIDMIGSGSEEDIRLGLRHYASEEDRRRWVEEWPDDEVPEHEDPPYDRDRTLPWPGQGDAASEGTSPRGWPGT